MCLLFSYLYLFQLCIRSHQYFHGTNDSDGTSKNNDEVTTTEKDDENSGNEDKSSNGIAKNKSGLYLPTSTDAIDPYDNQYYVWCKWWFVWTGNSPVCSFCA